MKKRLFALLLPAMLVVILTSGSFGTSGPGLIEKLSSNISRLTLQDMAVDKKTAGKFILLSDSGRISDIMMKELFVSTLLPPEKIYSYTRTQKPDGSWPDIDYSHNGRSGWRPTEHVTRMLAMAKAYRSKDSDCYNSKEVLSAILGGLDFWLAEKLVCPNWWYNEIGCPKILGPALILIMDELTPEQKTGAAAIMGKEVFPMTGQNKVWLAGNMLMKGILIDDEELIRKAAADIASELLVTTGEGLQPDWSFHQHGPQMQFGNYGLAYASSMTYWARALAGTELAFPEYKLELLRNYILEGLQWTVYRGMMDVNACARQVFRNAQQGKAASLSVSVQNMMESDPSRKEQYTGFLINNHLNISGANDLTGCRYFPRSDYFIYRREGWFASVRMHSDRIIGYEMTNDENLQGEYSSDGAMMLMVSGQEYSDIFSVWDWKRLPGVTNPDDGQPLTGGRSVKAKRNDSAFAGAVTDGRNGAAAMVLEKDGLRAKKAWFFIDNSVICLGSGIEHKSNIPVYSTVNQSYLKGDVICNGQVMGKEMNAGRGGIRWVHHGNTGYYFFTDQPAYVEAGLRKGSWDKIASMYDGREVEADIFTLSIDHGTKPAGAGYAYSVLPGRSPDAVKDYTDRPPVRIISNSPECQAVADADGAVKQYVFYNAGKAEFSGTSSFYASQPCIVMVKGTGSGYEFAVSDPTQALESLTLEVDMELSGEGCEYDSDRGTTRILISLPYDQEYRGGTVIITAKAGASYPH